MEPLASFPVLLVALALFSPATGAQQCNVGQLNSFNAVHTTTFPESIGQSFTACGSGAVTQIIFMAEVASGPGVWELWIAPEVGGDNTGYRADPPYETIVSQGLGSPDFATIRLTEPYPVEPGAEYRFVLRRRRGQVLTRYTDQGPGGNYAGGRMADDYGVFASADLMFEVWIRPVNLNCPAELPTDPVLSDNGGDPDLGPRVGGVLEPFNVQIDCSGAFFGGLYALLMSPFKASVPLATSSGFLYLTRPTLGKYYGSHTRSVETWFPAPAGMVLTDPALIGLTFTVQGYCGGYGPGGRGSNAIQQVIW